MTDCVYADSNLPHTLNRRRGVQEFLDDTMQIKKILHELRKHLSSVVSEWKRFSGPMGEMSLFVDIEEKDAKLALHKVEAYFAKLGFLEPKLDLLDRLCEESAKAVSLHL